MSKIKNICVFTLFLLCNMFSSLPMTAHAEEGRDVSNNVVLLNVTPQNVNDGENVEVSLEFNDKNTKIQPNDYIKVNWPNIDAIMGLGYVQSVDLFVKGKNVGKLNVQIDGATIVFNENIRNLEDVNGWVKFNIQVRNLTDTDEEHTGNLIVISGDKTAETSVTKPVSGTETVFYYKTGDMIPEDTQNVRWFLNINNNKENVEKNVIIKDEIQPGQKLAPSTFEIVEQTNNFKNIYYRGEEGVREFLNKYPNVELTYSVDENKIFINFPADVIRFKTINVNYKTTIIDSSQKEFLNNSKVWYKLYNEIAIEGGDFNYSVENINSSGGVNGTVRGELRILKKIEGKQIGIPNVVFELKRADGELIQEKKSIFLTTNDQGIATIKKLSVGDYLVKEVHAPNWIEFAPLTSKELKFTISETDIRGVELDISNEKKTIDVTALKRWVGGENPRPTIYFKLFRSNKGQNLEEVTTVDLGKIENGKTYFTWKGLEKSDDYGNEYTYSVKEVNDSGIDFVPNGYSKMEEGLTVTNKNVETTEVNGTKKWEDSDNQDGKRPEKITVNLLADGKQIDSKEVTEAKDWSYEFKDLPKFANGHQIIYTVTENQVTDYNTQIDGFNIINRYTPGKTSVSVTKKWEDNDNQDGKRPNNIQVQLLANGSPQGEPIDLDVENNWTTTWNDLDQKASGKDINYTISEKAVPGYTRTVNDTNKGNILLTNTYMPSKPKQLEIPNGLEKHLPKTNEEQSIWLIVVGLVLLITTNAYFYYKKNNKK